MEWVGETKRGRWADSDTEGGDGPVTTLVGETRPTLRLRWGGVEDGGTGTHRYRA